MTDRIGGWSLLAAIIFPVLTAWYANQSWQVEWDKIRQERCPSAHDAFRRAERDAMLARRLDHEMAEFAAEERSEQALADIALFCRKSLVG